jgi:hypothetical protein
VTLAYLDTPLGAFGGCLRCQVLRVNRLRAAACVYNCSAACAWSFCDLYLHVSRGAGLDHLGVCWYRGLALLAGRFQVVALWGVAHLAAITRMLLPPVPPAVLCFCFRCHSFLALSLLRPTSYLGPGVACWVPP